MLGIITYSCPILEIFAKTMRNPIFYKTLVNMSINSCHSPLAQLSERISPYITDRTLYYSSPPILQIAPYIYVTASIFEPWSLFYQNFEHSAGDMSENEILCIVMYIHRNITDTIRECCNGKHRFVEMQ